MSAEPLDKGVSPLALADAHAALTEKAIKDVYKLIKANAGALGGNDCAAKVAGMDEGDLSRALGGKGRYLAVDHVMRIAARMRQFNASAATQIAAAVVRPAGLLVFPLVELAPEEEARRLKKFLLAMPLGEQLLNAALEKP